jgi:hypothetical protein
MQQILEIFSEPFSHIDKKMINYIFHENNIEKKDVENFHKNIKTIFGHDYSQDSENFPETFSWYLFAELNNGIYITFSARRDISKDPEWGWIYLDATRDYGKCLERWGF